MAEKFIKLPVCSGCGGVLGLNRLATSAACSCEPGTARTGKTVEFARRQKLEEVEREREKLEGQVERQGQNVKTLFERARRAEKVLDALVGEEAVVAAYLFLDGKQLTWLANSPSGCKALALGALQAALQAAKKQAGGGEQ